MAKRRCIDKARLSGLRSTVVRKTRLTSVKSVAVVRRQTRELASSVAFGAHGFHRFVSAFEPWGIFLVLIGVAIAVFAMLIESEDRQADRTIRAWEFVHNIPPVGSSHRVALEYLNRSFDGFICMQPVNFLARLITGNSRRTCLVPPKQRESLEGIEVTGANLSYAALPIADLDGANLSLTNFSFADLSLANLSNALLTDALMQEVNLRFAQLFFSDLGGAVLTKSNARNAAMLGSDLEAADLSEADFGDASFLRANLTNAILHSANLSGANLTEAELTSADLEGTDITQEQLDSACGSVAPKNIPAGLEWRSGPCPVFRLQPEG